MTKGGDDAKGWSREPLMENLWSDADARDAVARYAEQGVGEDLALRVYSSRLLGC